MVFVLVSAVVLVAKYTFNFFRVLARFFRFLQPSLCVRVYAIGIFV